MEEDQPQFQLVKKLKGHVWLATRIADGEQFLAKHIDDFDEYFVKGRHEQAAWQYVTRQQRHLKGLFELLYEHNIGRTISHLFNHENIVSIAGYLRQKPLNPTPFDDRQPTEDYLIWDHCDAGNLEILLVNKGDPPPVKSFLPESLCWHVLTSVLRAFAWMHDGYRQEIDWDTGEYEWIRTDKDWMPILHRDIRATVIRFQHPRGLETYGPCKLSQFGSAFVSGATAQRRDQDHLQYEGHFYDGGGQTYAPHVKVPEGKQNPDDDSIIELRKAFQEMSSGPNHTKSVYTVSDEHMALGQVLIRMMTASRIPSRHPCDKCPGKCCHIRTCQFNPPCLLAKVTRQTRDLEDDEIMDLESDECEFNCDHGYGACEHVDELLQTHHCRHNVWDSGCLCKEGCSVLDVHIDDLLMQHDYSHHLIKAVHQLFRWRFMADTRQDPERGSKDLCHAIEQDYQRWKTQTEEGREYIDVRDDARRRYLILNNKPVPEDLCVGGTF